MVPSRLELALMEANKEWVTATTNMLYDYPNFPNNSVMITSALDAKEGCGVAIIDIHGVYLHTYVDKHGKKRIIMLFKGKLVDLIVMVDPKLYWKYVTYDIKGNVMLYVEMNKALYVLL